MKFEISHGRFSGSSLSAWLNYRFAQRLMQNDEQPQMLLDWCENQSIDRGMVKGFYTFLPRTSVKGYRCILQSDQYINLAPSPFEVRNGLFPKVMGLGGAYSLNSCKEFYPDLEVEMAPAFRYKSLMATRDVQLPKNQKFKILLALAVNPDKIRFMIHELLSLKNKMAGELEVHVRPHPNYSKDQVIQLTSIEFRDELIFSEGSAVQALQEVDLLVASESSICIESLVLATPVAVFSQKSGFFMNNIPENVASDYWRICLDGEDIASFIEEIKGLSSESLLAFGEEVRKLCFNPINKSNIQQLLT